MHPVLITVPHTTSHEQSILERNVIDAINNDDVGGPAPFWSHFYFYPYRNTTGRPLTPAELYDVVDAELGAFLPEALLDDLERLESMGYDTQRYSRPVVPTHYNEDERRLVEGEEWCTERMFVVVDDEDVEQVKLFRIDTLDAYCCACKRARQAGRALTEEQQEWSRYYDDDAVRSNCNDDGCEDPYPADMAHDDDDDDEWQCAAKFLGRPTAKWCRLRGVQATPIGACKVATAVLNLSQANIDFCNVVDEWHGDVQQRRSARATNG